MNVITYAERRRIETRIDQGLPLESPQHLTDLVSALLALAPKAVNDGRTNI